MFLKARDISKYAKTTNYVRRTNNPVKLNSTSIKKTTIKRSGCGCGKEM